MKFCALFLPVSYTHLDVYKRQAVNTATSFACATPSATILGTNPTAAPAAPNAVIGTETVSYTHLLPLNLEGLGGFFFFLFPA